jgi:hypothetical protein
MRIVVEWVVGFDGNVNHVCVVLLRLLEHSWRRRWRWWPSEMLQLRKHDGRSLRLLFWDNDDVLVHVSVQGLVDTGYTWLVNVRK